MDKNTVTGFILIAAVLIGFTWWNTPSAEQIEAARQQDSIAAVQQKAEAAKKTKAEAEKKKQEEAALADTTAMFHKALSGTAEEVVLRNDKLELTLSTKGGTVEKAVIKGYEDKDDKQDVTLFDAKDQQLKFLMAGKETNIITSDLFFEASNKTDSTVTMTAVSCSNWNTS